MTLGVKNNSLAGNSDKQKRGLGKTSFGEKAFNFLAILIFSVVFAGPVESSELGVLTDSNQSSESQTTPPSLVDGGPYSNVYANGQKTTITGDYGAAVIVEADDAAAGQDGGDANATDSAHNFTLGKDVTVTNNLYGGNAQATGGAGGNSYSGTVGTGGAATATASNNSVTSNSTVNGETYGGLANAVAGEGSTAIYIKDGDGGDATATANDNTVTIGAGASATQVFGGLANANGGDADGFGANDNAPSGVGGGNGGDGIATASNNTVTIEAGASVTQVFGGLANAFAGARGRTTEGGIVGVAGLATATASNNTVIINESLTFGNGVYIGELTAEGGEVLTQNNTVIVGGMAVAEGPGSTDLNAQNNIVILSTNPFSDKVTSGYIMGGATGKFGLESLNIVIRPDVSSGDDLFLGNRLVVNVSDSNRSISLANVKRVSNFQYFDFILGSAVQTNPVLTFDGNTLGAEIYFDNAETDDTKAKTSSSISSISMPADNNYEVGNTVTLIDYSEATAVGTIANDGETLTGGSAGAFVNPKWEISQDVATQKITAKLVEYKANGNAADIQDSVATPMFVAQNATGEAAAKVIELVRSQVNAPAAGSGIASGDGVAGRISPFASLYGSNLNYDDNSEIDLFSLSMVGGLAYTKEMASGDLTLSAFLSGTNASYSIKGEGANSYGSGDSYSLGLGLLGRYDFATAFGDSPYVEGSLHIGQVESDYTSYDFLDPLTSASQKASYDVSNTYFGLHFGLGYLWNLNATNKLDFFGKYLYTYQDSSDFVLLQQSFAISDTNSHRIQTGLRYTHTNQSEDGSSLDIYGGLRYEHEFDATLNGTVQGLPIDSTNFSGSTYVGEIGLSFSPADYNNLRLDLGVQVHQGTREGYGGNITLSWTF